MAVFWQNRERKVRVHFCNKELEKLLLKSLASNVTIDYQIRYEAFQELFSLDKTFSVSYYRRSCVTSMASRSVFRKFKMGRHQCKTFASKGLLVGLRKASF